MRVELIDEVGNSAQAMERDLDGEHAMALWRIEWESVGAGDYALVGRVFGGG